MAGDPDFLLEVRHVREWEETHGPLPDGGWLLYRTGWDARSDSQERFLNADASGPHTPGVSPDCARWLAEEAPILGMGVETVGTDAGAAHSFDPPFPCHAALMGSGKYGLTQLQNLAQLPPTGAVLVVAPLPIVVRLRLPGAGAGARRAVNVATAVGETLVRCRHRRRLRRGRVGQLRGHQRDDRGGGPVRGRPARVRRGHDGRRLRADDRRCGGA